MSSIVTWDNGAPEISPLTTVEDLLLWRPSPEEAAYCQTAKPLPFRRDGGLSADRPRLLACHDFRGNYLEDRFLQGGGDAGSYFFKHWDKIDGFCYFSHKLVTIPPPGWISAAHGHGVPILGTLITEWEAGEANCSEMLASDSTAERAAHQLAALASFLGFEGWVVNIENDLSPSLMPRLLHFLKCLTQAVHSAVPTGGYVLWYDAVTTQGRLHWQNSLTPLNAPFFDVCDGIWINYTWTDVTPAQVRAAAGDRGWDVYMGIDAFGRGTYGGGGLGCDAALAAARREGLSAALFACVWPYEKHLEFAAEDAAPGSDELPTAFSSRHTLSSHRSNTLITSWQARDDEFWKLIGRAWGVKRATLCSLPFFSDFSTGSGTALVQAGQILRPAAWFNLSFQSLQPSIAFLGKRPSGLRAKISPAAAFNGGTSVVLSGTIHAAPVFVRLFRAAAPVPSEGLRVRFTAAVGSGVQLSLCLRLRQRRPASEVEIEASPEKKERQRKAPEGELQLEFYTTAGIAGGRIQRAPPGANSYGQSGIFPPSQNHAVKLSSQSTTTPFNWLPSEDGDPSSSHSATNSSGGVAGRSSRPDEFSNVPMASLPKDWTTWQFAIGAGDLPGWDLSNSVLASVEVLAAPKTPGVPSPCKVFIGAISICGLDDRDSPPSCPSVFNLSVDTIAVKRQLQVGGGTAAVLSAVLEWKMAPWVEKCHIWARIGKNSPPKSPKKLFSSPQGQNQSGMTLLQPSSSYASPAARSSSASPPDISPLKMPLDSPAVGPVAWGPPMYIGTSSGTAFGLNNFVLPEDCIAVRVYVATATWATMQLLRNATAQSIVLPPGITSSIHQHMH